MGFRFHRAFKLLPGIRINLSKSGVSTSIGGRGATVNFGHGKTTTTVGIPGTGLSYRATSSNSDSAPGKSGGLGVVVLVIIVVLVVLAALVH